MPRSHAFSASPMLIFAPAPRRRRYAVAHSAPAPPQAPVATRRCRRATPRSATKCRRLPPAVDHAAVIPFTIRFRHAAFERRRAAAIALRAAAKRCPPPQPRMLSQRISPRFADATDGVYVMSPCASTDADAMSRTPLCHFARQPYAAIRCYDASQLRRIAHTPVSYSRAA